MLLNGLFISIHLAFGPFGRGLTLIGQEVVFLRVDVVMLGRWVNRWKRLGLKQKAVYRGDEVMFLSFSLVV